MNWTPHHVRGDTKCSFFSAARRTNQEAPPLLSGRGGRRLRHRRGLRNSLRSDSPRPLSFSGLPTPCPIKAGFCGSSIFSPYSSISVIFLSAFSHRPDGFAFRSCRTLMRSPSHPAPRCGIHKYPPLSFRPPMQHQVIPCSDAVSRKSRRGAPLLFLLCHELDPTRCSDKTMPHRVTLHQ